MFASVISDRPARRKYDLYGEYQEMRTAIELLSGKDCSRNVEQSRIILERLNGSQNREISQDSRAVIDAAKSHNWFDGNVPGYSELEKIAEGSTLYFDSHTTRTRIAHAVIAVLLIALVAAGIFLCQIGAAPVLLKHPVLSGVTATSLIFLSIWLTRH